MRVRTEEKRQEIICIAAELFDDLGYDRTSMSMISQRLGGSKATLYGYFKSKEELLLAVVEPELQQIGEAVLQAPPGDIRGWLRTIGLSLLKARTAGRSSKLLRIMSSVPDDSTAGRKFYGQGIMPPYRRICTAIEGLIEKGVLRAADPWTMAMHFKGLLDRDFFERAVLTPRDSIQPREIEQVAAEAADVFLRAYRAEPCRSHAGDNCP